MAGATFETRLLSMGNNTGIEVPPEVLEQLGVTAVESAKAPATRERRVAKIVADLAG